MLLSENMVELPDDLEWDMIVLDIDGTLLDRDGIIPEMIHIVRELERTGFWEDPAQYYPHTSITMHIGVHSR